MRKVAREMPEENCELMNSENSEKGILGKGMVGDVARTRGVDARMQIKSTGRE